MWPSLTVIRSSLSSKLVPSFLQEMVGSGCPRGGWHSSTAGSPTATITSTGFCLKSSRRTGKHTGKREESPEWNLMTFGHDLTPHSEHLPSSGVFCREEASISVTDCGTNSFHRWECDVTNCTLIFFWNVRQLLIFFCCPPIFLVPGMAIKCTKKTQTDLHFCKQHHF